MAALDMNSLNEYVRMQDHLHGNQIAEGTVLIDISHSNLKQRWPEIRFDLHTTIGAMKDRLYRHGGTASGFQKLMLKKNGVTVCELTPDDRKLGFFGVETGDEVHIVDLDNFSFSKDGGLENVNLVKKYVMSEEDYIARGKKGGERATLRAYKEKMREKDPYWTFLPENRREPKNKNPPTLKDVEGFKIGERCEIQPGSRRGSVAWRGECAALGNGAWVGIHLDEPLGKTNGTLKSGEVLFTCPDKHATFVRPDKVTVGDFPELDPLAELESSDEDEI